MAYAEIYEAPGRRELRQWCSCGLIVLGMHAAIVLALASRSDDTEAEAGAPVVMLELAPVWAAPSAEPSELPPGPQQVESEQIDQTKQQIPNEQQEPAPVPEVASGPNPTLAMAAPASHPKDQTSPTETRELPEAQAREEIHQEASIASAPASATAVDVRPAGPLPGIDPRAASAALMSWQRLMAAQLERHKHYPPAARGEQGVATLAFTVDRSGRLLSSRVVRSAGSAVLDADALALIKRAQPFPHPPPEIADAALTVRVPIRYIASGRR